MARKKVQATVERTFSDIERERYARAISVITECQTKAEGLAERIAGQLYIVSKKELFRIDDYTSMGEWAADKFDISKGTCSDAINTYTRFGSKDRIGEIDEKYQDYMFSTLIAMKSLTDAEIKQAGIEPTMSRAAVKQAITALKALQDKEKERPEAMKRLESLTKAVHAVSKDKDKVRELIESTVPDWFEKDKVNSVDEINACINTMTAELDNIMNNMAESDSTSEPDEPVETTPTDSTVEPDDTEVLEPDDTTSVHEMVAESEPIPVDTIPSIPLNVEEFRREDGSINKKQFLDTVWKAAQAVFNHNGEIVLTWNE